MTHPLSGLARRAAAHDSDPRIGIFTWDAQKTRIAGIHARIRAHYEAVKKAEDDIGAEPELVEYATRWRAFMREMNDLGERANSTLSWVTDGDLDDADSRLNLLLSEWEALSPRITLRRARRLGAILEDGLRRSTPRDPGDPVPAPLRVPDPRVQLPESAATRAPAGPPAQPRADGQQEAPPVAIKLAALFTLAATSVAATAAMKSDLHRAAAAGSGLLVTAAAGWAMFWPSQSKKEEKK